MAKPPFRVTGQVVRDELGKFDKRYMPPTPPQIIKNSEGKDILQELAKPENQAPDHPSPGGRAGAPDNPWPEAKGPPIPPMRLRGG